MASRSRGIGAVLAVGLMLVAVSPARGAVWSVHQTQFAAVVSAVSCVSATACTAVGGVGTGLEAMGWDGRRWRLQPTPDSGLGTGSDPAGVSCTSSKDCVAVGDYVQSEFYDPAAMKTVPVVMPFAEHWNGVAWSLLPVLSLPPGAQDGGLAAVSCRSGLACMAVGGFSGVSDGLFAERWDGASWSLESMPNPVPAASISQPGTSLTLLSVSCSSGNFCTAVGSYNLSSGHGHSFAERWNGSRWSLQATIDIAGAFDTRLAGVSCASPRACVAVGEYNPTSSGLFQRTLAERWNGTSWSVERTPNAPGQSNELVGVSCARARACLAVGDTHANTGFQPLVERRGSTSWSIERTPSAAGALPEAVSCTSSMVCTVVGNAPRANGVVAEQSAPASAKLTGIPAACASARFTARVTGAGIASVAWSLDSKAIKGRRVHRGTRYVASIRLTPGRHKLTVKVKFTTSSRTHAVRIRRNLRRCSPAR